MVPWPMDVQEPWVLLLSLWDVYSERSIKLIVIVGSRRPGHTIYIYIYIFIYIYKI